MSEADLLTSTEVSHILRVHRATVLRWAREGKLPVIRLSGRSVRFRLADVDALIETSEPVAS